MAHNDITRASPKEIGSFFKWLLYQSTLFQFSPSTKKVLKNKVNNYFSMMQIKKNFQIVLTGERAQIKGREERRERWKLTTGVIFKILPSVCSGWRLRLGRSPELCSSTIWGIEDPRDLSLTSFLHEKTESGLCSGTSACFEVVHLEFQCLFICLLAIRCPWSGFPNLLNLSFLICNMKVVLSTLGLAVDIENNECNRQVPGMQEAQT